MALLICSTRAGLAGLSSLEVLGSGEEKCGTQKMETIGQSTSSLHATVDESSITYIKEILLGEVKLTNYLVAVIDLAHVNKTYAAIGKKPIYGILGSDILLDKKAVINYAKKQLTLK